MKADMYDVGGNCGPHDTFQALLGAPGGFGDAAAPQEATDYLGLAEMGGSSNLQEKLSLSSLFSLGHHSPFHQVLAADARQQQLEGEVTPDGSIYYHPHHHHGGPQRCLDPSALPMFLAPNPVLPPGDGTPSPASTVLYDPPWPVQMDLCNQGPLVGDVLQWLPNEYGFVPLTAGVVGDGGDVEGCMGQSASAVLGGFHGLRRRGMRGSNSTEKERRGKMSEKFAVLRSLIPNPTKHDKASIIAEATEYIKELLRTIRELRALVEAKRRRERSRKISVSNEAAAAVESSPAQHCGGIPAGRPSKGLVRCSWLQRKYKDTSVDVRIIEDEVNIRLVRRQKADCLLLVAGALHELQLELLHLAAGHIGDSLVFMINSKIEGGSSVYASAIAKKLVEALEGTAAGVNSL